MHKKDPSGQGFLCNMQSIHREKTKTTPNRVLFCFGWDIGIRILAARSRSVVAALTA